MFEKIPTEERGTTNGGICMEKSMTSPVFCDVTGTIKGDGTTVTFASRHTYRDVRYDVKQENPCVIDRLAMFEKIPTRKKRHNE